MAGRGQERLILEDFIPYRLNKVAEGISQGFARHYRDEYGLTRPEWRVLATLGQFGSRTAREIGQHSSMHKTKVSRAVQGLEKRHWLKRARDETDRCIEHLELTPAGTSAYDKLAASAQIFQRRLLSSIGGVEARHLSEALAALEDCIKQYGWRAARPE
jgi:DNA-binding MarR family transcriptional regulator